MNIHQFEYIRKKNIFNIDEIKLIEDRDCGPGRLQ